MLDRLKKKREKERKRMKSVEEETQLEPSWNQRKQSENLARASKQRTVNGTVIVMMTWILMTWILMT